MPYRVVPQRHVLPHTSEAWEQYRPSALQARHGWRKSEGMAVSTASSTFSKAVTRHGSPESAQEEQQSPGDTTTADDLLALGSVAFMEDGLHIDWRRRHFAFSELWEDLLFCRSTYGTGGDHLVMSTRSLGWYFRSLMVRGKRLGRSG